MMPTLTKDTAITLNSGIKVSPSYWVENAHTYSLLPSPTSLPVLMISSWETFGI